MKTKIQFQAPRIDLTGRQIRWIGLFGILLWMLMTSASAQTAPAFSVLDGIGAKYTSLQFQWSEVIRGYAIKLFLGLAAIDFGWLCATFILDKKDVDDMMASVMKKLMTLSFFFFLLMTTNTWIPQILGSFKAIGMSASGATALTPDSIAVDGFDAALGAYKILDDLKLSDQITAVLPVTICAILIFLSFLWAAAQFLVTQIESALAIGSGVLLMGFGGSRWTTDMASKYMQYAVATGVKLMLMYLIIGAGKTLFSDMKLISGDQFIPSLLQAMGTALLFAFLTTKVPAIASGMMSGAPSMSAGDMAGAAIGAGAAIAGLGAAGYATAKGAAGAASGAAVGATGVAKALGAGMESGMDLGKSGAGLAAHAVGEAAKHGLGLAGGAIGDRVSSGASNFAQAVDNSAGGRVASSIQASRGGSMAGVAPSPASSVPPPGTSGSATPPPASPATSGPAGTTAGGANGSAAAGASAAGSTAAGSANANVQSAASAASASVPSPAAASGGASSASGAPASAPPVPPAPTAPAAQTGASGTAASSPAPAAGASASGSSPNATASAAAPGASPAPQDQSAAPTGSPLGDASTGAVSGGTSAGSGGGDAPQSRPLTPAPLHERIKGLQGYVPDDAAHAATLNIDINHSH
ncbi:P-type conjugative transfer protein TrbL [Agrobacterium tumefaciens]|uniref:P-type conjugative transfer protein TrbL n=1 Tax=Agrobacterium tumefaciens TaxID=358 RepID=UPI0015724418|nr:P-type conjugative transfer protein TrbL [Agrobacterium tumefaciens]NTB05919.1 P-type conjugative transfer protein TrbL [Agrobacterium tumefaciens]